MGLFILLFLVIFALEFFLASRPGRWRFFAVILPASAFFFWMDRQSYWVETGTEAMAFELMLVGTWAAAAIAGAIGGLIWDKKRKKF